MPSFILIHPTVWPQYTNVTDRQDRQQSDSVANGQRKLASVVPSLFINPNCISSTLVCCRILYSKILSTTFIACSRDVRILRFCTCRTLCTIGQLVQNWLSCAELTKRHRNCKILQILFSNIALSLELKAATASSKHFCVKVTKYFAPVCI